MAFTSWLFVAFTAAAVAVYYLLPKKLRWTALLLASYVFYLCGGISTAACLLFTTLTTYGAGLLLERFNRAAEAESSRRSALRGRKKLVVFFALLLNFLMLFLLKYLSFTVEVLRLPVTLPELVLPLGVSFYVFQSVGYVIDCYRGGAAQKNPAKYALFVSFFPQMVQGPISRYRQLAPQLLEGNSFRAENLKDGLQLALVGYLKKMVLAERAGVLVSTVFGAPQSYSGSVGAVAVAAYCLQLYCDFSGGIDITRGVARLFGIDMAENFRRPLFSTSLADYWRRWHITLGQWMRDYVFFPLSLSKPFLKLGKWSRRKLGGKAGKILPTSLATFIIYLIIGIWHGANFRYMVYGLWNGAIITGSFLLEGTFLKVNHHLGIRREAPLWRLWQIVRTALIVFAGRYMTRAPRLLVGAQMFLRLFTNPRFGELPGVLPELGLAAADLWILAIGAVCLCGAEYFEERGGSWSRTLEKQSVLIQWLAILLPMAALLLLGIFRGSYIPSAFIYQQY